MELIGNNRPDLSSLNSFRPNARLTHIRSLSPRLIHNCDLVALSCTLSCLMISSSFSKEHADRCDSRVRNCVKTIVQQALRMCRDVTGLGSHNVMNEQTLIKSQLRTISHGSRRTHAGQLKNGFEYNITRTCH